MEIKATETGTLADLNAQPRDVVEYFGGRRYTVLEDMCLESHFSGDRIKYSTCWHTACFFRIISRASATPPTWDEMTDAAKVALLMAHHMGFEIQCLIPSNEAGEWMSCHPTWNPGWAYRIKPQPVVGEVVPYGSSETGLNFSVNTGRNRSTHILTFPTIDGELVTGTFTSPDGHVVKVEEV